MEKSPGARKKKKHHSTLLQLSSHISHRLILRAAQLIARSHTTTAQRLVSRLVLVVYAELRKALTLLHFAFFFTFFPVVLALTSILIVSPPFSPYRERFCVLLSIILPSCYLCFHKFAVLRLERHECSNWKPSCKSRGLLDG
jgi:hypothetical protein